MWDDRDLLQTKLKRSMKKYTCTASHATFCTPQLQTEKWWSTSSWRESNAVSKSPKQSSTRNKGGRVSFSARHYNSKKHFYEERDDSIYWKQVERIATLEEKQKHNQTTITNQRNALKYLRRQEKSLRSRLSEIRKNEKPTSLSEGIIAVIEKIVQTHYSRYGMKRVGEEVARAVWSVDCLGGSVRGSLIKVVKGWIRQEVFNPRNIVRAMDLFGGMLSFQAIRVLRWIEGNGESNQRNLMIPSVSVLQRYLSNFTAFCSTKMKINFFQTASGEGFETQSMLIQC